MSTEQLLWRTEGPATLAGEQDGYLVTVERLLPGDRARFVVREEADPAVQRASGTESSVMGAIVAATSALRALSIEQADAARASADHTPSRVACRCRRAHRGLRELPPTPGTRRRARFDGLRDAAPDPTLA